MRNGCQNDTILRDGLLNAVFDHDDRRLAYHKPADKTRSVISDLNASLATSKRKTALESQRNSLNVNYVNRRYVLRMYSCRQIAVPTEKRNVSLVIV